jgi:adenylate cyclase
VRQEDEIVKDSQTIAAKSFSLPQWGAIVYSQFKQALLLMRQRLSKLSIVYRIAASFTVLIVVGMGLLGAVVLTYQNNLMREQVNQQGRSLVTQFAHSATEPLFTDDLFSLQVLVNQLVTDAQIRGAVVFDENNQTLFASGDVPALTRQLFASGNVDNAIVEGIFWQTADDQNLVDLVSFATPISFKGVVAGHALVTLTAESLHSSFQHTMRVLVFATVAMMLLAISIAYWLSRRLAKPVTTLVSATEALARGEFSTHITWQRTDELGQLAQALNNVSQSLHQKQQMEGVLSRFVADDVAKTMMDDLDKVNIGCVKVDASVLFVDIVGYTELAERASTEAVVELLNEYLAYFTLCSQLFFGTVDKFIGDCAMVIFGAPRLNSDHRFNAIACATVMLRLLGRINDLRQQRGQQKIDVRIGINSGNMMAGFVGARQRMEYTVVGDTVNIASRLSRMAEPGEIIVGEDVVQDQSLQGRVHFAAHREVTVKGRRGKTRTYHIVSIDAQYQRTMDTMIDDVLRHNRPSNLPDLTDDVDLIGHLDLDDFNLDDLNLNNLNLNKTDLIASAELNQNRKAG